MIECSKARSKIKIPIFDKLSEFWYICNVSAMTAEQKKKLLKAKVAVALQNELGRVPKEGGSRAGKPACPRSV